MSKRRATEELVNSDNLKRKPNFSEEATNVLVDLISQNKTLLFGKCTPTITAAVKRGKWEEIAMEVSAIDCTERTVEKIKNDGKMFQEQPKRKKLKERMNYA